MAGQEETKDEALAAKAYEAAAAKTPVTKTPVTSAKPVADAKVEAAKVETKPEAAAPAAKSADVSPAVAKPAPSQTPPGQTLPGLPQSVSTKAVTEKAVAPKPAPAKVAKPAKVKAAKPAKPVAVKPPVVAAQAAKPATAAKTKVAAAKPVIKPAPAKPVTTAQAKPVTTIAKAKPAPAAVPPVASKAAKTAGPKTNTFAGLFNPFILEEKTMDISANFAGFQDAVTEAQAKAKAAFEKSSVAFGEAGDFAKGNVEAVIESGKIFAEGLQGFGSEIVAESRTAFETLTGDIKELAAAKSPTDFFKLQGDIMRKNFDSAVAYGSKNSEAALKLFSDTMAPISGRVSVAVEKARQVAA